MINGNMDKPEKPWNIQVELDDPALKAALRRLVDEMKIKTGDQRTGGAAVLEQLLRAAVASGDAEILLGLVQATEPKKRRK